MSEITPRGDSPFIDGFTLSDVRLANGVTLRVAIGGEGPPLLMLHGHPQNHLAWRKIAPQLAQKYRVILPDLRGYGDSDKPVSDETHRAYSKRVMADDISLLIDALGLERVAFVGHDRGARVGHRLALDHPEKLSCCVFVDIAPTATMYALTNKEFATRYFWWFFLIQPYPLPETMIGHDPALFLSKHIDGQLKTPGATEEVIFNDYLRCYQKKEMIHAVCEDYRAAATIDLDDDAQDSDKRIEAPLLLLWGEKGTVGQLYNVVETWQDKARHIQGHALPCGHSPHEEVPELFLSQLQPFLDSVL
ncbi:alpha/beta fold hydrolase [Enterobacteriaceae bacterium RIT702]|nr:alpha/beta fold hydrolase [Enterobacteriaceae bacterium RIT702]